MIKADILLRINKKFPDLSIFPMILPTSESPINQIHETIIHVTVNIIFSSPWYCNELVPITPTVSMIACGFNKETDAANNTCFFKENLFTSEFL
jgi:hypothetical protein